MVLRKKSSSTYTSAPPPTAPPPTAQPPGTGSDDEDELCTDGPAQTSKDSGLTSRLEQLLRNERQMHEETKGDLAVERAAHDETAEKMVELQHRLEVTLQELANLERFVKMQQQVKIAPETPQQRERLLREEAYLQSRLNYVQQELAGQGGSKGGQKPPSSGQQPAANGDEEGDVLAI
uniref:Uncharacterized protein n=1 Tax=Chrysotila carterae TaxID=13221 RepID=A0A7S4BM66_CHRCT|mmetsp:Transcript_30981/g.65306  ORF Transcript_30981/g.65306 Transcript_30981/m.65306 type:complete len:178 (-) Transcript_30981:670-1203(-)